jgi:hypothetical protein
VDVLRIKYHPLRGEYTSRALHQLVEREFRAVCHEVPMAPVLFDAAEAVEPALAAAPAADSPLRPSWA